MRALLLMTIAVLAASCNSKSLLTGRCHTKDDCKIGQMCTGADAGSDLAPYTCVPTADGGGDSASDRDGPVDAYVDMFVDRGLQCEAGTACDGGVCNSVGNMCVECNANSDCTPQTNKPICETSGTSANTCRGCKSDTECTSGPHICLDSGRCATDGDVVYAIQPTASCSSPDGSVQAPYCTAQAAVDAARSGTRRMVVLRGSFGNFSVSSTPSQILIVGQSNATIGPGGNIYGIDISGTANISIRDLTVTGGSSTTGVAAHVSGANAVLNLVDVQITGNAGGGVLAEGGGTIVMDRCVVRGNNGSSAALKTSASQFHITNCVFANSGNGAILDPSVPAQGDMTFKNNTIVGNATGIQCAGSFAIGLLFAGNGTDSAVGCSPPVCCGSGDPNLTSTYHLMSPSPCIDRLDPDSQVTHDLDGQPRPYPVAGKSDCGADEYESL
jgi:hypothetical protein